MLRPEDPFLSVDLVSSHRDDFAYSDTRAKLKLHHQSGHWRHVWQGSENGFNRHGLDRIGFPSL
jgi:hypothetical protein